MDMLDRHADDDKSALFSLALGMLVWLGLRSFIWLDIDFGSKAKSSL